MLYIRETSTMAKVMIEVDTEEGTVTAMINGKAVKDVQSISVYVDNYNNKTEVGCNIGTKTTDDSGVRTYTSICAEHSKDGIVALSLGTMRSEYDDFLINPVVKASQDDGEYAKGRESVKKAFSNIFGNRRDK